MFPKIGGKPPKCAKWMVKIMENPIKMDDLGAHPYFWKHPYLSIFIQSMIHIFPPLQTDFMLLEVQHRHVASMDPHFSSAKQLPTYCTAEPLVRTAHNATSSFRTPDRFCWAISVASPHKSIFGFSNSTELC